MRLLTALSIFTGFISAASLFQSENTIKENNLGKVAAGFEKAYEEAKFPGSNDPLAEILKSDFSKLLNMGSAGEADIQKLKDVISDPKNLSKFFKPDQLEKIISTISKNPNILSDKITNLDENDEIHDLIDKLFANKFNMPIDEIRNNRKSVFNKLKDNFANNGDKINFDKLFEL